MKKLRRRLPTSTMKTPRPALWKAADPALRAKSRAQKTTAQYFPLVDMRAAALSAARKPARPRKAPRAEGLAKLRASPPKQRARPASRRGLKNFFIPSPSLPRSREAAHVDEGRGPAEHGGGQLAVPLLDGQLLHLDAPELDEL